MIPSQSPSVGGCPNVHGQGTRHLQKSRKSPTMRHCSAISLSSREPPFVTGHSDRLAGAVKPQARRLTGLDVCDR
jgi:hypothetical protein